MSYDMLTRYKGTLDQREGVQEPKDMRNHGISVQYNWNKETQLKAHWKTKQGNMSEQEI